MRILAIVFCVFSLGLVGCGGGDDDSNSNNCDVQTSSGNPTAQLLWSYNASFDGGYTVRWPAGPVYVKSSDSRVDDEKLASMLSEINLYIYPAKLVLLEDENGTIPNIKISHDPQLPHDRGDAKWYSANYYLYKATVKLGNFNDGNLFYNILKHELLHSVGFFGHTSDGGVMDLVVSSGTITETVKTTLLALYSLPAGTLIAP